jgi:type IV secretion system protein VirD4
MDSSLPKNVLTCQFATEERLTPTPSSIRVTPFVSPAQQRQQPTLPAAPMMNNPQEGLLGLLAVVIVLVIALEVMTRLARNGGKRRIAYGSAHFASRREARVYVHRSDKGAHRSLQRKQKGEQERIPPPSRLVIGRYLGQEISLDERQQTENVLLTAPVGSGKSSGMIIPNVLRERGSRSLVISDVKGELYPLTAGTVSQYHEVRVFRPADALHSHCYNPLAHIETVEDAQDLAQCWVMNTGQTKDEFWPNAARKLLTATILHLHVEEPNAPFSRIADLLTLTLDELSERLTKSQSQAARRETQSFFVYMKQNEKMTGSLMTDISTRLQLFASEDIRTVTSRNELDFVEMTQRPTALYLSLPTRATERLAPLFACLTMQMFAAWQRQAERCGGRLPRSIGCYFDEFTNLGYIPNFGGYISTVRSSGIALLLAIQNFHQLVSRYGPHVKETILSNCVTHLVLPGAGLDECQFYSQRIGDTTIDVASHSESIRTPHRQSLLTFQATREGQTKSQTRRPLLSADEIRTLPKGHILMVAAAQAPLLCENTPYYRNKRLRVLANIPCPQTLPREAEQAYEGEEANTRLGSPSTTQEDEGEGKPVENVGDQEEHAPELPEAAESLAASSKEFSFPSLDDPSLDD